MPVLAWLLFSPWIPPSLLWTIRANSSLNAEVPPEARPLLAFGAIALALALTWLATRRLDPAPRWILLFACPLILTPVLFQHQKLWFIPQPGRYKMEAEFVIALLIGLALHAIYRRAPVWFSVALTLPVAWVLANQVVPHRRFAKAVLKPVPAETSIEARSARWIEANLPGQRVMLSGSMAQWANAFADVDQLGGFSYPTTPNPAQQMAVNEQHWGREPGPSLEWLRRFGVTAVAVPGPKSPEFWKPYQNPGKYEGVLSVLWREDDTTIYAVPGPPSPLKWRNSDRASFTGSGSVDVGINAMPGWHTSRGVIRKNEFGLMQIDTGCAQPCTVELTYAGSMEAWLLRLVSLSALVLLVRRRW
ncbi:MAG: hypothetical protein SGI92_30290 [Bryobacteraceae bacterium]|nr:hypothetical protein [Bryobacteraceae bacterium]